MVWQTVFLIVGILFVGGCNGVSPDLTFEVFEDSLNSMAQAYLPRLKYNALIPGYTTTTVKKLLPGAYEKCPDCNIKCFVTFVAAPTILLLETGENHIKVRNALINLTAVSANGDYYGLLLLDLNGTASADFGKEAVEGSIPVSVQVLNTSSVLLASYIGDLPISHGGVLDKIVNAIAKGIIVPKFNKNFPGIPLPHVEGASLTNISVNNLKNDRLTITGDVKFAADVGDVDDHYGGEDAALSLLQSRVLLETYGNGMNMKIGENALEKSANKFAPTLKTTINNVKLPSFSGKGSVDDVSFQYSVDEIAIEDFSFSSISSVQFQEGDGPVLQLSGITMSIPSTPFTIKKHMYVTWLSCDGTLTASLNDASVNVVVNITKLSTNGAPSIHPKSSWDWGSLSVNHKFSGTLCQWASTFASYFDGDVNSQITKMMKSIIPTQTDAIIAKYSASVLNQLTPSKFPFDKDVDLDMSLQQNPITSDNDLEFQFVGKFTHVV
eukprot:g7079.t1